MLSQEDKHDKAKIRRVVHELTKWAVALGADGAQKLLDELYADGTLAKPATPSPITMATFTDLPPWLRDPTSPSIANTD